MSRPEDLSDLAGWKAGLLARIQERGTEHARLLYRGYPDYDPGFGRGDVAIQTWRAHLRDLEAEQQELIVRAGASAIPHSAILAAIDNGAAGRRWGESVNDPPTTRHGEDPVRAQMIAAIAEDVWTLEHMAVIAIEREHREVGDPTDSEGHRQYLINMDLLWERVDSVAALAELTQPERDQLWGRDAHGWDRLVEFSVEGYDDLELEQIWRTHAWAGIAWDLHRSIDNMAADPARSRVTDAARPPTPQVLLERAREAVTVAAEADPEAIGHALSTTGTEASTDRWLEPVDHPPDSGFSGGVEW
ncbi:hypothetical protein [Nocardia noduli]|uniref:hypothetical protein n=1 Tax=Nocardia noduli TaxID=2815722 RepID=UPI001C2496EB|nr:hypothetical protein [Nocardia noduli]